MTIIACVVRGTCLIQFEYYARQTDQGHTHIAEHRASAPHIFTLIILIFGINLHRIHRCNVWILWCADCIIQLQPQREITIVFFFSSNCFHLVRRNKNPEQKRVKKEYGIEEKNTHARVNVYESGRDREFTTHLFSPANQLQFNLCACMCFACLLLLKQNNRDY